MPSKCFVPGCPNGKSRVRFKEGLSFHKIPKGFEKEWLTAIGRDCNYIVNHEVICSAHFNENEFEKIGAKIRLKSGAIPSLNLLSKPIELSYLAED